MQFTDSEITGIEAGITLLVSAPFIIIGLILFSIPNKPGVNYWSKRHIFGLALIIIGIFNYLSFSNHISVNLASGSEVNFGIIILILILLGVLITSVVARIVTRLKR